MIRVGDRGEVRLNGCRLALVPLAPEQGRPVFHLYSSGLRVGFERVTLREFGEGFASGVQPVVVGLLP
ncbi:MAG: hypothetical protein AAF797_04490 [Planctomycetota bacterium]